MSEFHDIIEKRKFIHMQTYRNEVLTDTFVENIIENNNEITINQKTNGALSSLTINPGIPHLSYDENEDLVISTKPLQTTLNSIYLGNQHKISSGAENVFFTNLGSNIDWFPVWQGIKDQSLTVNQDSTGLYKPTGRIYADNMVSIEQLGLNVSGSSIDFNDTF